MDGRNILRIIISLFLIYQMSTQLLILKKITPVFFPKVDDDIVIKWKSLKTKAYVLVIVAAVLAIAGFLNVPFMLYGAIGIIVIFIVIITKVNLMQKKYKIKSPV